MSAATSWFAVLVGVAARTAPIVAPRLAARTRWRRLAHQASPTDQLVPEASKIVMPRALVRRVVLGQAHGRRAVVVTTSACALAGLLGDGPVAGAVLAAYGGAAAQLVHRSVAQRARMRSRQAATEAVAALAAELRAGVAVSVALDEASMHLSGPDVVGEEAATVARRVASAVDVAESSGAPLADVLDRLDAHLRSVDRAQATAAAQAAGARASALLLACMPVAGVGLGFLVGIDPMRTLLHTPIGAVSLLGAVVLQLAGLAWAGRLSRVQVAT